MTFRATVFLPVYSFDVIHMASVAIPPGRARISMGEKGPQAAGASRSHVSWNPPVVPAQSPPLDGNRHAE